MRIYRTHDIALAAFLIMHGYVLQAITGTQRREQWQEFEFNSDPQLDDVITKYFDGGMVAARTYASTVSHLKTAMYKQQRGESYELRFITS